MEGNISSGSMMISEYRYIKAYLKKMDAKNNEFRSMFLKMIEKTKTYLKEAMGCDTIVVATILNPIYQLSLFQTFFPKHYSHTKDLITDEYNKCWIEYEANITVKEIPPPVVKSKNNKRRRSLDEVDLFPDADETMAEDELSIYLRGMYKQPTSQANEALDWWKVHYPFSTPLSSHVQLC